MTFTIHIAAIFISIGLMAPCFRRGRAFPHPSEEHQIEIKAGGLPKGSPCPLRIGQNQCVHDDGRLSAVHGGRAFGFISARINWGTILSGDPKEFISLVVWGLYAWLFHQRFTQGWQGRKPAILAIWIFTVCAFSLIVVNLFMTTHHSFLTTPR